MEGGRSIKKKNTYMTPVHVHGRWWDNYWKKYNKIHHAGTLWYSSTEIFFKKN
jgi:hypothetical protein